MNFKIHLKLVINFPKNFEILKLQLFLKILQTFSNLIYNYYKNFKISLKFKMKFLLKYFLSIFLFLFFLFI